MNLILLIVSVFLLLSAMISFITNNWFAISSVAITDIYLILILILSAYRSDKLNTNSNFRSAPWIKNLFPNRRVSLALVFLLVATIIVSFAGLYYNYRENNYFEGSIKNCGDAIYFSFVTFTTLGYGDIHPILLETKLLVMCQLASGMLLLFGVFPLLISRISNFTESEIDQDVELHSQIIATLDRVKSEVNKLQQEKNEAQKVTNNLKNKVAELEESAQEHKS